MASAASGRPKHNEPAKEGPVFEYGGLIPTPKHRAFTSQLVHDEIGFFPGPGPALIWSKFAQNLGPPWIALHTKSGFLSWLEPRIAALT